MVDDAVVVTRSLTWRSVRPYGSDRSTRTQRPPEGRAGVRTTAWSGEALCEGRLHGRTAHRHWHQNEGGAGRDRAGLVQQPR